MNTDGLQHRLLTLLKLWLGCALAAPAVAADPSGQDSGEPEPALIVGIVVDQMRHDMPHRYRDGFGSDGFKRLMA